MIGAIYFPIPVLLLGDNHVYVNKFTIQGLSFVLIIILMEMCNDIAYC